MSQATVNPNEAFARVLQLQRLMTSRATGGGGHQDEYAALRRSCMADPRIKALLPDYVRSCRDLDQFWPIAKSMDPSWAGRRSQLAADFGPLLDALEVQPAPPDLATSVALAAFGAEAVSTAWAKALERRDNDPEGAITASRALLETVLKHVLEDACVEHGPADDLPKLYSLASKHLNLSPSQHSEDAFKRILSGCVSVVTGLGSVRNQVGDAHGQGRRAVRPTSRHARLAVNLAGAMAAFMVETVNERQRPQA